MDDGRVGHCELAVDGARWMMSDEFESAGVAPPGPAPRRERQPAPHRRRLRRGRGPRGRARASPSTGVPRTARRPAGSRCSATRSATAGSSTSADRRARRRSGSARPAVARHAARTPRPLLPRSRRVPSVGFCGPGIFRGVVVARVLVRVTGWSGARARSPASLARSAPADAVPPPFVAVGHSPTQGTPVPGGYLIADLGTWTSPPESYDFQWLRDGAPIAGADTQDYLVQVADIGHSSQPQVTGHSGAGHRRLRRQPDRGPQDRRRAAPRRTPRPPDADQAPARLDGDLVHVHRAALGHRRRAPWRPTSGRTAGSRSSAARSSPAARRSCGCRGRGAARPHQGDGLLPRHRRRRVELLALRRRPPRR